MMDGLRLNRDCFPPGKTDLGIRQLVQILTPDISHLFGVTHGDFLFYPPHATEEESREFDRRYGGFFVEEGEQRLKFYKPGFLAAFGDSLYGDWTRFYLLSSPVPLSLFSPWLAAVPEQCTVLICCVDAAYWEVFARDVTLLAKLKSHFPSAVSWKLEDKKV